MPRTLDESRALHKRAEQLIPGGVNSPVRAFRSVGGEPPFVVRGEGAHVWDADGNRYIDYVGSWGPLILGHSDPEVIEAVIQAARHGTSFGASTPTEADLAALVVDAFPAIEKVRFVSSGTEATMSAIRLARAATGRKVIVKFEGCYHGHSDALLVKAGSGVATLGIPGSAGVPEEFVEFTLALPYNDIGAVEAAFARFKGQIACLIVEPVVGNMGCVPPQPGYLEFLREITAREGALLIFDEVMTGFRVAFGGATELFHIKPDLTTLGKIIGGGLPVGAYGAPAKLMDMVAPLGPVYQAGTLSGNPLAMAAGIATLCQLKANREQFYRQLDDMTGKLVAGVTAAAKRAGVAMRANRVGSMFTFFFTDRQVMDWQSAAACDTGKFGRFHGAMLDAAVWLPPSQFEAAFLSTAHTPGDLDDTIAAATEALALVSDSF
ncbi:MAG TPA: glutamate-1-semialdehyde 2,1-aminomutase [Candidatus Binatia bacterium]|nr:glutamate-1-semialdehyde 2,1-aminomutase [Candidatus Binatia bacterium]